MRELLAMRNNSGAVIKAKDILNLPDLPTGFTAALKLKLTELQTYFRFEWQDGVLDRETLNLLDFLANPVPLPKWVHTNGARILYPEGPTSLEVHLGTVGEGSQLMRHQGGPSLPELWRPENMHTAYRSTPWHYGSFGNLTPPEERFYCCQRWPWANVTEKALYRGRRVKITNKAINVSCICTPGDFGPADWTTHIGGVSPDVMLAVGGMHGTELSWEWVADGTPLGRVAWSQ